MNNSLQDHVYIITGAAGGLGATVAKRCAAAGAKLILTDRLGSDLEAAKQAAELSEGQIITREGEVTDPSLGVQLAKMAYDQFGRLDGGAACAGVIFFAPLLELKPEHWDTTMAVNLRGTFFFLQGVGRTMIAQGTKSGSLITISASSARGPRPNNADYGASKAAVEHVTKTFALELAPHGIRVNSVSPGVIPTPMWQKVDRDRGAILGLRAGELTEQMAEAIPLGRIGKIEEIAAAIDYFFSEDATFTTGQVLGVDGGFCLANA